MPGARSFLEIAVHAQRDGDVVVVGEKHRAHRHRLQRLLGHAAAAPPRCRGESRRARVDRERRAARRAVVAEHVVQRRLQIGVAESLDDDSVDLGNLSVHRMRAFDAHDRPDADRRVERRPEMEFVRRVRLALGRDDAAEWRSTLTMTESRSCSAVIKRSASHHRSQEFLAVTNAVHHLVPPRVGQRDRRAPRRESDRDTSSARAIERVSRRACGSAISTRTNPHIGSCPTGSRRRRYQLATVVRFGDVTRNTLDRSPARRPNTTSSAIALGVQRAMALHDADDAIARRAIAIARADSAVDEQRLAHRARTTARPSDARRARGPPARDESPRRESRTDVRPASSVASAPRSCRRPELRSASSASFQSRGQQRSRRVQRASRPRGATSSSADRSESRMTAADRAVDDRHARAT